MIRRGDSDVAAVDIHYLHDQTVQATLVAFEEMLPEHDIPDLLAHIDEVLLPEVSLDDKKLVFTVISGRVLGAFEARRDPVIEIED